MELTQEEKTSIEEKTFYQDTNVRVTQARFIAENKTYAMRNISSVFLYKINKSLSLPFFLIFVGFLLMVSNDLRMLGLATIILGFVVMVVSKDKYAVRISTNAGETNSLVSKDKLYIQKIVNAVNDAMIHRG